MSRAAELPAREEADLLAAWGQLVACGADVQAVRRALAGEPRFARFANLFSEEDADDDAVPELTPWVRVLVFAAQDAPLLDRAASLRASEAEPTSRGHAWAQLAVLDEAGASPGDALAAIARSARRRGFPRQGEAFYAAAKRAREGADLGDALAPGGFGPVEDALLQSGGARGPVYMALARAGAYGRPTEELPPVPPSKPKKAPDAPLTERLAGTAAPLKRGFERMLSGIEGALGIGPPEPREREPEPAPAKPQPRVEPAPQVVREPVAPPPRASSGGKKTIGGDSGLVQVNDVHGGGIDAAVERDQQQVGASLRVDAWYDTLDEAAAKLTLLEVQADPQTQAELEALFAKLEGSKAGLDLAPKRTNQLVDLQWRFKSWKRRQLR